MRGRGYRMSMRKIMRTSGASGGRALVRGRKFVLRFGSGRSGLCFSPQGGQARNNVPLVFGPCKNRNDVFRMTSSGALASVAFRGYYVRLSAGRLVLYRSARMSARFKFTGGRIMVKSGGGRYMYVQSQGGARASMGMMIMAKSTSYRSWMRFSCMKASSRGMMGAGIRMSMSGIMRASGAMGGGGGARGGGGGGGMFVIRHKASGLCLYPKGGLRRNDNWLVLDRKCRDRKAVFRWTRQRSLQLVAFQGFCLHVYRGSKNPADGTKLVIYKTCNEPRLSFRYNSANMGLQMMVGKYVQPSGRRAVAGMNLVVRSWKGAVQSWMKFEFLVASARVGMMGTGIRFGGGGRASGGFKISGGRKWGGKFGGKWGAGGKGKMGGGFSVSGGKSGGGSFGGSLKVGGGGGGGGGSWSSSSSGKSGGSWSSSSGGQSGSWSTGGSTTWSTGGKNQQSDTGSQNGNGVSGSTIPTVGDETDGTNEKVLDQQLQGSETSLPNKVDGFTGGKLDVGKSVDSDNSDAADSKVGGNGQDGIQGLEQPAEDGNSENKDGRNVGYQSEDSVGSTVSSGQTVVGDEDGYNGKLNGQVNDGTGDSNSVNSGSITGNSNSNLDSNAGTSVHNDVHTDGTESIDNRAGKVSSTADGNDAGDITSDDGTGDGVGNKATEGELTSSAASNDDGGGVNNDGGNEATNSIDTGSSKETSDPGINDGNVGSDDGEKGVGNDAGDVVVSDARNDGGEEAQSSTLANGDIKDNQLSSAGNIQKEASNDQFIGTNQAGTKDKGKTAGSNEHQGTNGTWKWGKKNSIRKNTREYLKVYERTNPKDIRNRSKS